MDPETIIKLLDLDKHVQKFTRQMDAEVEKLIESERGKRQSELPNKSCEVNSGALPVSTGLNAVQHGALKVVLRVMPGIAVEFLEQEVKLMLERIGAGKLAKMALKKVPGAGTLGDAGAGTAGKIDYYNEIEKRIHEVLGCVPNKRDTKPMRFKVNQLMVKIKERGEAEPRLVRKVRTRRP